MEGILFPHGVVEGREGSERVSGHGADTRPWLKRSSPRPRISSKKLPTPAFGVAAARAFPPEKNGPSPANAPNSHDTLVLNGGEDEPGSKKDRMLMEHLPHLVIEGVILSAYAIGASKAYLYINANYEAATKSITDALGEAKTAGYWGDNRAGSNFSSRHRTHARAPQLCSR